MTRLLDLLEAEHRCSETIEWAERWISLGEKPEAAYRSLMVAYAGLGDRAKVLATYERCVQGLGELGLEPSEEIRALRDIKGPAVELPAPMTSFIGRQQELGEVSGLLLTSRLVTLTGAGGVGENRLAIEVARAVASKFPDGVCYIELASVEDPAMVPGTLLGQLHISGGRGQTRSITDLVAGYFHSRRALLVLDNCEHLIEACAQLVNSLVTSCADLRVLVTSREGLRVAGENAYRVPSLGIPSSNDLASPATLARVDSVRLFVERSRAHAPSFALTQHNAQSVSQICTRLDGIPLAIELAAGRVGTLSVESIAGHISERFALLTGGARPELPRHQTLRALIDWSHDLLSGPERVLLRRLAVFAGGWTLEAAQAIAAIHELRATDVLRLLPELVEKSLVVFDAAGGRYHLLETVRAYALEHLREAGEEAEIRTRHLDYWLALIRGSNLDAAQDEASFAFLAKDHGNLLAAIKWCDFAEEGAHKGMELIGATRLYWKFLGQYELSYELARHVLGLHGAGERNMVRQRALYTLGQIGFFSGHSAAVAEALEESVSIAREFSDTRGMAESLQWLGNVSCELGNDKAAVEYFQEALALSKETGQTLLIGMVLNNWGECLRALGRFRGGRDSL